VRGSAVRVLLITEPMIWARAFTRRHRPGVLTRARSSISGSMAMTCRVAAIPSQSRGSFGWVAPIVGAAVAGFFYRCGELRIA